MKALEPKSLRLRRAVPAAGAALMDRSDRDGGCSRGLSQSRKSRAERRSRSSSYSSSSEDSEELEERERAREIRREAREEKDAQEKAARKAKRERAEPEAEAQKQLDEAEAVRRLERTLWRFTAAGDEDEDSFALELRGKKPESLGFVAASVVDCTSWEPLNDSDSG